MDLQKSEYADVRIKCNTLIWAGGKTAEVFKNAAQFEDCLDQVIRL
jgi:hypothetical protein